MSKNKKKKSGSPTPSGASPKTLSEVAVSDPSPEGRIYAVLDSQDAGEISAPQDAVSLFVPAGRVAAALDNSALDEVPIIAVGDIGQGLSADGLVARFETEAQINDLRAQLGDDGNLAVEIVNRHEGLVAGEAGADLLILPHAFVEQSREEAAELVAWWSEMVTLPLAVAITALSDEQFWLDLGADYTLSPLTE